MKLQGIKDKHAGLPQPGYAASTGTFWAVQLHEETYDWLIILIPSNQWSPRMPGTIHVKALSVLNYEIFTEVSCEVAVSTWWPCSPASANCHSPPIGKVQSFQGELLGERLWIATNRHPNGQHLCCPNGYFVHHRFLLYLLTAPLHQLQQLTDAPGPCV